MRAVAQLVDKANTKPNIKNTVRMAKERPSREVFKTSTPSAPFWHLPGLCVPALRAFPGTGRTPCPQLLVHCNKVGAVTETGAQAPSPPSQGPLSGGGTMACDLLTLSPMGSIVGVFPHPWEEVGLRLPIPQD